MTVKALKRIAAAVMALAMVISTGIYASAEEKTDAAQIVAEMTLREKICQMIMPAMRSWDYNNATTLSSKQLAALSEFGFGGIILFSENISGTQQTVRLTDSIQKAAKEGNKLPMFIAIDQEGGIVTRLTNGTSTPGNMALAATGDKSLAKKSAEIIGAELKALGINIDFAPDTDVNANPSNPVIGVRSFSDDPQTAAEYALEYISGLESNGTVAAVKHFPGHGDTATDSHVGLPLVEKTYEELLQNDLVPFKAAIDNGIDWVMTAHIQYPLIEKDTYVSINDGQDVYLPSTLSDDLINDVLRTRLGYNGIVSTDAMEMKALIENFTTRDTAKLAINAGIDVLLMPVSMDSKDGIDNMRAYVDDIEEMVNSDEIDEATITESATRIVSLKVEREIIGSTDNTEIQEKIKNANKIVGCDEHHAEERAIADKAITLTQNTDSVLPLKLAENDSILLIGTSEDEVNAMKYGITRLVDEQIIPEIVNVTSLTYEDGSGINFIKAAMKACTYVIVTSKLVSEEQLSASAWQTGSVDKIIESAHENGKKVIVICVRNPYDIARYPQADAVLAAYNSSGMTSVDSDGYPRGKYGPNIPASMDIIFGKEAPTGKLPVNIMKISADNKYTDEVLYARGYGLTFAAQTETSSAESAAAPSASSTQVTYSAPESKDNSTLTVFIVIAAVFVIAAAVIILKKKK